MIVAPATTTIVKSAKSATGGRDHLHQIKVHEVPAVAPPRPLPFRRRMKVGYVNVLPGFEVVLAACTNQHWR